MAVREMSDREATEIQKKDLWLIQERLLEILLLQEGRTVDPDRETIRQSKETHEDRAEAKGHMVERAGKPCGMGGGLGKGNS